ncbi:MAG: hypothetical protein ACJ8AT_15895 [Hyalangium sp.]|uniref:hypothetical protein n=1 Tax=Hyalangium sp. TaxID=2028555 RepID=UPI00389ACE6D
MTPTEFENHVLAIFGELMAQAGLRRIDFSHERAFSTVLVGNEHAGIRVLLEWRELHVQVEFYRCVEGRLPAPPAVMEPSPNWLSLGELAETGRFHPLEIPLLTASHISDEGLSEVTPQDVMAYLMDVVPLVKAVGAPWFRGRFDSFETAVHARDALLAEPELSAEGTPHLRLEEGTELAGQAPAFVAGVLDACAPLVHAGWRDVWYATAPRVLAMALADPQRQIGVEVRMRWPRPVNAQVELLLLEAGRLPPYERLDRRVTIRWALEARGAVVPQLDRGAGLGLYAFVGQSLAALARTSPEFLLGDGQIIRKAQLLRQDVGESLGADFR